MLNLVKQCSSQILIITDQNSHYYIWKKGFLSYIATFNLDEQGHNEFYRQLEPRKKLPLIIVTDLIDEGFRNESIVHVGATDRKALLNRKLNYTFRSTPYRVAAITGREQQGRRDDNVLLSAITKPELLQSWIDKAHLLKVQIQAITSAAYLLEGFVNNNKLNDEPFLLVASIDENLKLRQSFFKEGKILFSRSITLTSTDKKVIANDIYQETLRIRRYLERIKLLHFESSLSLTLYSPFVEGDLRFEEKASDMISLRPYNINEEASRYNLNLGKSEPSALMLLLANSIQKSTIKNIYAPFEDRRYYHLSNSGKMMTWGALALIVLSLGLKTSTMLGVVSKRNEREQITTQTFPLQQQYSELSQRFPETPIPSKEMALVVETAETIQDQEFLSTSEMLNTLSQALLGSPNLELTNISWRLEEEEIVSAPYGGFGVTPDTEANNSFPRAVVDDRTMLIAEVDGFSISTNSYRGSQNEVQSFVDSLDSIEGVTVNPLRMPTDVRQDTTISTTVGNFEVSTPFSLELIWEGTK